MPLPRPKPDDDEVDCVIPLDPNKLRVHVAGVVVVLPNPLVDPNPLCCC
jgi:hypothetical protein